MSDGEWKTVEEPDNYTGDVNDPASSVMLGAGVLVLLVIVVLLGLRGWLDDPEG